MIETTFAYTRENLSELHRELYRKNARRHQLLALAGIALLIIGIVLLPFNTLEESNTAPFLIFLGVFWTLYFLISANGAARKATKSILKSNLKHYDQEVITRIRYYPSAVKAVNEASGSERTVPMTEIVRLLRTKHLIAMITGEKLALLADRRLLDEQTDEKLWELLCEKCTEAKVEDAG